MSRDQNLISAAAAGNRWHRVATPVAILKGLQKISAENILEVRKNVAKHFWSISLTATIPRKTENLLFSRSITFLLRIAKLLISTAVPNAFYFLFLNLRPFLPTLLSGRDFEGSAQITGHFSWEWLLCAPCFLSPFRLFSRKKFRIGRKFEKSEVPGR